MKKFAYGGALVLSLVLGGVSTLVGVPRFHNPATLDGGATISPLELQRGVGPLPETFVQDYV